MARSVTSGAELCSGAALRSALIHHLPYVVAQRELSGVVIISARTSSPNLESTEVWVPYSRWTPVQSIAERVQVPRVHVPILAGLEHVPLRQEFPPLFVTSLAPVLGRVRTIFSPF